MERRFPFGIPNGWFLMAYSEDLAVGDVRPLHYLDHDFVAVRGESGRVSVFDAYCPHLGAHLGHGGRVEGDGVRATRLDHRPHHPGRRLDPAPHLLGLLVFVSFAHQRVSHP